MTEIPNLLNIGEVTTKIKVTKSCIYRWISEGKFPRPLKLSPTCVRWREDDVARWLQEIETPGGNDEQPLSRIEPPRRTPVLPARTVDTETLQEQVRLAVQRVGGTTALARALGIEHTALYGWKRIPSERVLDVEILTGIPCCELRPDIYPPDRFLPLPVETL